MIAPGARVRLGEASGRWVLFASVLGSGMAMLDTTVVNVALPTLGDDLGAGVDGLQWTIDGYTLTLAAFLLLGGSLGDRFGRRRVFVIGAAWFAVASLACALAPSIEVLVAARALQGIGAALLTPGSLALISSLFAEDERGRAIGLWSGLGGIAGAIGPFAGGWLIGAAGWRWVFLVNVPIAVLVIVVARRHVPESRDPDASHHLDVVGAASCAIGLGGLTAALVRAGAGGVTAVELVVGGASLLVLAAFVLVERTARAPMIPLGLFASRQFIAGNLVTFLIYAALSGVFFVLVLELQVVGGHTPLAAGASLLPVTALVLVLSGPAGALAQRIGPRVPMAVGPLVSAAGVVLMLRIGATSSYVADVLPAAAVFGLGLAITVAPLTSAVLGAAAERFAGVASGVNNAVARTASLLAIAVLPMFAGLRGEDYRRAGAVAAGARVAMTACAVLLAAGGVLAALTIRKAPRPR